MRYYPQLSMATVTDRLPMAQGWALLAAALNDDPWREVQIAGDGYIAQEAQKYL